MRISDWSSDVCSSDLHAKAPCRLDMLLRHIGLGAMRRDAHRAHAKIIGALEIMDGADAGEPQGGEHAMLKHLGDRPDPVQVGVRPEPIVDARSLQAVPIRDLARIDLNSETRRVGKEWVSTC